jgi:uncharacterized membrane protein YphA (DoxX/SURF4 family)
MSLLRFAARSLLASHFVINGVNAVRKPEDYLDAAQPVMDLVSPPLHTVLPDQANELLPTDAAGWARLCGAAQVIGGLSLATGVGRRFGAALLASTMLPQILTNNPLKGSSAERTQLGADVALLGGVVLAALDTEGQPSLAWKLRAQRQLASKQTKQTKSHNRAKAKAARKQLASTPS